MLPEVICVLPRIGNDGFINGFRACVPKLPGCVVILGEQGKAAELVSAALYAAIAEEIDPSAN